MAPPEVVVGVVGVNGVPSSKLQNYNTICDRIGFLWRYPQRVCKQSGGVPSP